MINLDKANSVKFIIHQDWRGWGVWVYGKNWRDYNALEYFLKRSQAEEFKSELLLHEG